MTFRLITFDVYIVIVWNWSPDQFEWSVLQSHFNLDITVHTVFHRHLIEDFWRQILAITNVTTKTRCVENFQEYFDKRNLQGIFWKMPQGFCSRCCTKLDLPQMPTLLLRISLTKSPRAADILKNSSADIFKKLFCWYLDLSLWGSMRVSFKLGRRASVEVLTKAMLILWKVKMFHLSLKMRNMLRWQEIFLILTFLRRQTAMFDMKIIHCWWSEFLKMEWLWIFQINLIAIMAMGRLYEYMAERLTVWGEIKRWSCVTTEI